MRPTPAPESPDARGAVVAVQDRLTLRNLYLYLVCLITLVIAVFAAVQLVRSTVALVYPDPGFYGYYGEYPDGQGPSEAELQRQEEAARDSERRQAVLSVVGAGTTLLIAGPLYLYHWRRVQAELPVRGGQDEPATPAA
jgi:hypothetical protein